MRDSFGKRSLALSLIVLMLALAGCSPAQRATNEPTATTAPPTVTPTLAPTAIPTADPTQVAQACGKYFPTTGASLISGLAVANLADFGNQAYPSQKLPDNLPLKPFEMPAPSGQSDPNVVPLNPRLQERGGGYVIILCNVSSSPHTVKRVDARIDAITPISITPNSWQFCTGMYQRPIGVMGTGCGGADFENEYMHASFAPTASVGTTVTATQTGTNCCTGIGNANYGPLPVTLQPGQGMTIEVGMGDSSGAPFTTSGYYTFSFGVGVDGAAPIFAATSTKTLLASNAMQWTGANCESATMQAQIPPATNPPTYYVCPNS